MPNKLTHIMVLLLLVLGGGWRPALAKEILIVQGGTIPPYEEAIAGFEQTTGALDSASGVKSILAAQFSRIILNPGDGATFVQQKIKEKQPDLLLAVGQKALDALVGVEQIPIVFLMVVNPDHLHARHGNLAGVKLALAPAPQLAALLQRMPEVRKVGVIYDARHTAGLVKEAAGYLAGQGRELVAMEAGEGKAIGTILQELTGKIDVLWMVPDRTVISLAALESMALFSMQTHIPIVTFSEKYLQSGALLAITSDPLAMGKQAGLLANRIIQGAAVNKVGVEEPGVAKITTNDHVAEHLGSSAAGGANGRGGQP